MKRLPLLGLLVTASCGPVAPDPVSLEHPRRLFADGRVGDAAASLQQLLSRLEEREPDYETEIARVRIHLLLYEERARLDALSGEARGAYRGARHHLASAGRRAILLLAGLAPPSHRTEAADSIRSIFLLKSLSPELRMQAREHPVESYLMCRIADAFALHGSEKGGELTAPKIASRIAAGPEVCEEYRSVFTTLADPDRDRSSDRSFAELPLERHVQEGTHAQDLGTRELAARGDLRQVLRHYLDALQHLLLLRECCPQPSVSEQNAVAAIDILYESIERIATGK